MGYGIGKRLYEARKALKLTQMEFGKKIGVSDVTISTTESGKTPLTEANSKLICLMFNINESWLRTGEGSMFNETSNSPEDLEMLEIFDKLSPEGRKMAKEYTQILLKNEIIIKTQIQSPILKTYTKQDAIPEDGEEKATHSIHDQARA